jgi:RHS repeat-associated protein
VVVSGTLAGEPSDETRYFYNATTARLDSIVSTAGTATIARARWTYDRGGRVTEQRVAAGTGTGTTLGQDVVTSYAYDVAGRAQALTTTSQTPTGPRTWYQFASPSYNALDQLRSYTATEPGFTGKTYAFAYDTTDGTGRLLRSEATAVVRRTYVWSYDVFGNRHELFSSTGGETCQGTAPLEYGPDNRLLARHSFPGCTRLSRYWSDQAGNRVGETDTLGRAQAQLTYTAAGQLYYSLTPTVQAGTYDYNWHWYDGDGRRVLTQTSAGTTLVAPRPELVDGTLSYYVYDGSDVALVLARPARGGPWWVKQRPLVGGVDRVLAGRYSAAGTQSQNLVLVADRQGSTVAAVRPDGTEELSTLYPGRNAFGALEGASAGGATNTETGFTGASTPNQTGGFTYLRNRWYDPATGRFLTQDPIGLAGGVNLYAYAGNDPVQFSDPFGLCDPKKDGTCLLINAVGGLLQPAQGPLEILGTLAIAPLGASGGAGGISAEVLELGSALRTSTSGLLRAGGVADRVAGAVGGAVSALEKSDGFKVTVDGAKNIVARIKATGDMRVSIDQVGSLTREGAVSSQRALTHLKNLTSQELIGLVEKAKDLVGAAR